MRPTWKGFLTLSLVNIPVRLYPAARSQSLSFNQIHKECNSRIKLDKRCPNCERSVSSDELVKGYEYAKEQYVIMDEEDFTKVRLESTKSINIVQFVERGEIDPLYYHGSHYIVPDGLSRWELRHHTAGRGRQRADRARPRRDERKRTGRRDPPRDRAFVMSALYYANEVRALSGIEELEATPELNPEELQLASQLIDSITKAFEPRSSKTTTVKSFSRSSKPKPRVKRSWRLPKSRLEKSSISWTR